MELDFGWNNLDSILLLHILIVLMTNADNLIQRIYTQIAHPDSITLGILILTQG